MAWAQLDTACEVFFVPDTFEVYQSFVREMATCSDKVDLLGRLGDGHDAGPDGWCSHPGHDSHWERHPCPTRRLALIVADEGRRRP